MIRGEELLNLTDDQLHALAVARARHGNITPCRDSWADSCQDGFLWYNDEIHSTHIVSLVFLTHTKGVVLCHTNFTLSF